MSAITPRISLSVVDPMLPLLGSIVRVQVAVDGGRFTADLFNERLLTLPAAGDSTLISFPVHACWVMV